MGKISKNLLFVFVAFLLNLNIHAQLSGVYSIPGNYPTLAAALADLNTQGVNGPVIMNIIAGHTETAPSGGFSLTATGTAINTITFQKSGSGPNPLLTAHTGVNTPASAVQDGVWRLIGCDYITINGIDITDPNAANPGTMEYGYGLFKANTSDGCQNNTIQNCVITLRTINNATGTAPAVDGSRGINVVNSLPTSQTTAQTPVSAAGANSNNRFYANIIQNCNIGISLIGYAAPSPFALADSGNDIGGLTSVTGNTLINFGGGAGATNPAAGVRTLAQYSLNISYNIINNNNGSGANHPTTIRGVFVNTAQSADATINNNTLTINTTVAGIAVSAIENLSGSTAANNTITIRNNLLINCSNAANTTGSFFGIFNNAASPAFLNISDNTFDNISTRATTGSNYLIFNTGVVTTGITFTNNLISNCTNSASTSGSYYNILNNVVSPAALNVSNNTFSNNTSFASTGATHFIYNSLATSNSITMNSNVISACSNSISSTGAFYAIFNGGASTANLEMRGNSFINHTLTPFSGNAHLIYNTAAITNSIVLSNNLISNCTSSFSSTGSHFAIYNNAGSSSNLEISNNVFTGNAYAASTGSVHLIFNRGAATNTFVNNTLNNNLIANCSHSASSTSPFLGICNGGVTSTNLSIQNNTLNTMFWSTSTASRFVFFNTGSVTNVIDLNNNLIANVTASNNTTGTFNGVYNTGACTVALNMCSNTFTNNFNRATTGGAFLIFNSGALAGGVITMTNNLIAGCTNSATAGADFYGMHNSGTTFYDLVMSNNTYTNNSIFSSTGATNLFYNTGAVTTSVNSVSFMNNLVADCSNSVSSTGTFFGIYNNNASAGSLFIKDNIFSNYNSSASTGASHLIYNRGTITNTFALIDIQNNLITNCTNAASGTAPFYSIWNNGITSAVTSIKSNTITNTIWNTVTSLRYLISNWGVSTNSVEIADNLISNCTSSLNTTNSLFGIYNNNNTTVSSGALLIHNNIFRNNTSTGSTNAGETHYINSSGVTTNTFSAITITNNLITNCTSTISGNSPWFGIYNNSASAFSLNISSNTFTNNSLISSSGPTHLLYSRGVTNSFFGITDVRDNLISNCLYSASSTGILYGIWCAGTGITNNSFVNIVNNTFTNNISNAPTASNYLIYNTCPANNSITISNNVISSWTNSTTTTGTFFGINNGGASVGDLSVQNNTFKDLLSSATSGARTLIYNNGAITNSLSILNNFISGCSHSITGTGAFNGINNNSPNSTSALDLNISNNTYSTNFSSATSGNTYLFINSGAVTTTITNVAFTNNLILNYTVAPSSGPFYGVLNSGFTSSNLSIQSNTLSNVLCLSTSSSRQMFMNNARVTNSISISQNLASNFTSTLNTTGTFQGITNAVSFATSNTPSFLTVTNNQFTDINLSSTSGVVYLVNNTGAGTNTILSSTIDNNSFGNLTTTITSGGAFYGIYNTTISSGTLSVTNNTFTNVAASTTSCPRYMIFNAGPIVSSFSVSNNVMSNVISTVNTTGSFFGIINTGNSQGDLVVENNTLQNWTLSATTGSLHGIFNTGLVSNGITFRNNGLGNISHSATTSGGFLGIYNSPPATSISSGLDISSNTFTAVSLYSGSGASNFIYNRGANTHTISAITITNNIASACTHSASAGAYYGIYNNLIFSGSLSVLSNTFLNTVTTTTTAPRHFIYNSGAATSAINIAGNAVSNYTSFGNTTASFYDVYNTGACAGDLNISNNEFNNHILATTTGTNYLIYNTASITNSVNINGNIANGLTYASTTGAFFGAYNTGISSNNNLSVTNNSITGLVSNSSLSPRYFFYNTVNSTNAIRMNGNHLSNYSGTLNTTGAFFGVYNAGHSQGIFEANSNSFNTLSLSSTTVANYIVYNTGTVSSAASLDGNSITNFTNTSGVTGTFYGVTNLASPSQSLSISNNTFNAVSLSTPTVASYLVYSSGVGTISINSIKLDNNTIKNCSFSSNVSTVHPVANVISSTDLSMSGNTFSNCITTVSFAPLYIIYNNASLSATADFNNNTIADNTYSLNPTGEFYGIYNSAVSGNDLKMNGNLFSNNSSQVATANSHLIYNSSNIANTIDMTGNTLGFIFSNSTLDYIGDHYAIHNNGGTTATTLNISGNNFTNYSFPNISGTGDIYFIRNTNNNSRFDLSNNSWSNLVLNHTGNEYMMFNPTTTGNVLNVTNNSITSYSRTAAAGGLYIYHGFGNSPATCTQVFSGNNFSNITATVMGTGSFYGLYSADGLPSSQPKKSVFNNSISNVNYNGLGFMYPYYFDFLGDAGSPTGSSINNNTLSVISWGGPLYGVYAGSNVSSAHAVTIYSNTVGSISSSGSAADLYGVYLTGGGAGSNFHSNKIHDITANGNSATVNGLYLSGVGPTVFYNNLVGNLAAPVSDAALPINGVNVAGGSQVEAYYNTVYLSATGTGTSFNTSALFASSAVNLNLRNNIFVNTSTPNGSGITAAYRRSSTSLGTYSFTSNNNLFYAGIPAPSRVILYDGSTSYQILPTYQALVTPRDNASLSEDVPFLSTTGINANFLHINPASPSLTESGAVNISGITNDFDNQARHGNPGYTGAGTAPDIGADEFNQSLIPCNLVNSASVAVHASTLACEGQTVHMYATNYSGGGSIVQQWKVSNNSGGPYINVSGGAGANYIAYTTGSLTAGTYYYVLTTSCTISSQLVTSNELTVVVNALPTASAAVLTQTICAGQSLNLSAGTNIGTIFNWSGPNNFTSTIQNPIILNAGTGASGVYTLIVSDINCTALPVNVSATVNATPPAFSLAPVTSSLCVGASQTITASIPITTPTLNFGSQTNQNIASGYPAPYSVYYGGQKMQILVLAGELNAAGFTNGTPITSIQFPVVSKGANWGNTLHDCRNFMVGIKSTTTNILSSFETGLANIVPATNFTPVVGFNNIHSFSAPFIWDGTSNIVIETVFSNTLIGSALNTVIQYNSPTGFQSTLVYRADNQSVQSIAAATSSNVNVGFVRPDFKLNGVSVGSYSWGPATNLSSTTGGSVVASPTVSTVYTATLSDGQCESYASASINVILIPTVTIVSTSGSVCVGNNATLTASGAMTYTWSAPGSGSAIVVSPFISTIYSVTGSNPACPNATASIQLISLPALTLTPIASPSVLCQGQSSTLTVSGASSYTWAGNSNSTSIVVAPNITTNYNVSGSDGPGCWATKAVTVKVNPLPSVAISPSLVTLCLGETIKFEASGAASYTWLPGNSNLPILAVTPNVSTVYNVTATDVNYCTNSASATLIIDQCIGIVKSTLTEEAISVFPNPSAGSFIVRFGFEGQKKLVITNTAGELIKEISVENYSEVVHLQDHSKGVYFLQITSKEISRNYKLIVE